MEQQQQVSTRNMVLFFVFAGIIMFAWSFFVIEPQQRAQEAQLAAEQAAAAEREALLADSNLDLSVADQAEVNQTLLSLMGDGIGSDSPRVPLIIADSREEAPRSVDDPSQPNVLEGSINLANGRIDAARLMQYRESIDPNSPVIELLKPSDQQGRFYVDFDIEHVTPGNQRISYNAAAIEAGSIWQASAGRLTRETPLVLSNVINGNSVERRYEVVDNYMVRMVQTLTNNSDEIMYVVPQTLIRRDGDTERDRTSFTGPVVANGGKFYERNYEKVRKNADSSGLYESWDGDAGWIGMTDKYWMVAAVPERANATAPETSTMRYFGGSFTNQIANFEVETRPQEGAVLRPGESMSESVLVFIGAKEVATLNRYRDAYDIKFFSRGIDFSFLYFITQPFAEFLIWLNSLIGNAGWAIIVLTLIVKAILFYPNDRAYRSMERMKLLQPQVQEINERYADDSQAKSQKMMELYRETGVNPLGGCLPIFIQMPVFLALYRVLNVTLETRHAPWLLWIQDLSAKDPLSILNGFGLLPWDVPTAGLLTFISIGPLAITMGLSMVVQQRMSPPPTDPTQRQIFALMPIVFTFVMANFAAGLVLYWTANNLLTIVQQFIIKRSIANDQTVKLSTSENRQKKRFDEQKKRNS